MTLEHALVDIYALLPVPTSTAVAAFFDAFCPNGTSASSDYTLPDVLAAAGLTPASHEPASFYFRPAPDQQFVRAAMVHFCDDGAIVVGLSIAAATPRQTALHAERTLQALADAIGATYGYCLLESLPNTESCVAFQRESRISPPPSLVNGVVFPVPDPDSWLGPTFLAP